MVGAGYGLLSSVRQEDRCNSTPLSAKRDEDAGIQIDSTGRESDVLGGKSYEKEKRKEDFSLSLSLNLTTFLNPEENN